MKQTTRLIKIAFVLFLVSCKKDDSDKPLTNTELLTNGSWKLTAVESDEDGDGTYETNRYTDFNPCYTDNVYAFQTNGSLQIDEGNTKCAVTDPQTYDGTWQFADNESVLKINQDPWIIEELTSTTLKWKEVYSNNRSAIVTFSKL